MAWIRCVAKVRGSICGRHSEDDVHKEGGREDGQFHEYEPEPQKKLSDGLNHYVAVCLDCAGLQIPFKKDDDGALELVQWARAHAEANEHYVMIPFKVYERVGR